MPFVPVANTVMAEIRMSQDFQNVENTLYFEFATPPAIGDLVDLSSDLQAWWIANYGPLAHNGVTLREIFLTDLTSSSGPTFTRVPPSLTVGGVGGEALPNNVTCSVSFRTGSRGRSFRGRNYFVGLADSQVAHNTLASGFVTALIDAYEALAPAITSVDVTWVVVSRFSGGVERAAGVTTPILTVSVVDDTVDSMRTRLPGRGT